MTLSLSEEIRLKRKLLSDERERRNWEAGMRTKDKLIRNWKDLTEELEIQKPDSIVEEIILGDSINDVPEEEIQIVTKHEETKPSLIVNREHILKNALLRGLLPHEGETAHSSVLNQPVIRRCCIEHCYFARKRSRSYRYNLRSSLASDTVQFENDNSNEQQTIDFECLGAQDGFADDSVDKNNVNDKKIRNRVNSKSSSSSGSESPFVDDISDRDYCPEDNSSDDSENVSSIGSGESDSSSKGPRSGNSSPKNVSDVSKCSSFNRLTLATYPKPGVPSDFVSVHDLLAKIKKMQKLIKAKKSESGKSAKVPPPRLKKISGRGKSEDASQTEYMYPLPSLTKMTNGDKDWKMEYMDDEVQNLGLDDLLLKASELNAENFTKALGQKVDPIKPNFNAKDNSEIVFTIPKSKKNSVHDQQTRECGDSDFSKRSKTIKLDISKPFFEPDKAKEAEPPQETPAPPEEALPKRPGIKVKTVENINEEFKDSLGLKNKVFQECNANDVDKESPFLNSLDEDGRSQEETEKNGEGGTPFVMTIIQSKAEKQRPAILRNSTYFKKKDKTKALEKEEANDGRAQPETSGTEGNKRESLLSEAHSSKSLDNGSFNGLSQSESFYGENFTKYPKVVEEAETQTPKVPETPEEMLGVKKRNIPFILNHNRKVRQARSQTNAKTKARQQLSVPTKLVKDGTEKATPNEKTFKVTSIEQKVGPKEKNKRFIKVVPYEPVTKPAKTDAEPQQKVSDDESDKNAQKENKNGLVLSLGAFYTILREILPDKWVLCLDKKYGLQIMKTHVDKLLNPSILMSVVIARSGQLTVNVRGKQLDKSHEVFSNLCSISNSENKLSLNYVLALLNKLRCLSVCFGCDDPTLKKYWCDEGFVEQHTESQQVYRSHLCQFLVSLGKKRCNPCYRMNETFKIRYRRDKLEETPKEQDPTPKTVPEEVEESEERPKTRGVKRNLEDLLEESFSTMRQQISNEIEKNRKLGERENALKAQEEVLSFMGLARKDSLDNAVRKSKRKKNSFYKLQQPVKKKINQQELEFLEKYWTDINTLFSTSLLFGAYSRTGRGRLRENCRMFHKLLTTWRDIVKSNPEWIGGEISLPDELTDGDSPTKDPTVDQFEQMDVPALRAYIINSAKEVNRIKHKLRTRNSYFKLLYNKFVKRRMKRPKSLGEVKGTGSSANSTTNTPTPTDFSSDESSRDRGKTTDEENRPAGSVPEEARPAAED